MTEFAQKYAIATARQEQNWFMNRYPGKPKDMSMELYQRHEPPPGVFTRRRCTVP